MTRATMGAVESLFAINEKNAKGLRHIQAISAVVDAFQTAQSTRAAAALNVLMTAANPLYPQMMYMQSLGTGLANAAAVAGAAKAEEGMNEIVTEPTLILAGEAGAEYVDIEPTTNEGAGRGGGTVIFQGNILSDDFIVE